MLRRFDFLTKQIWTSRTQSYDLGLTSVRFLLPSSLSLLSQFPCFKALKQTAHRHRDNTAAPRPKAEEEADHQGGLLRNRNQLQDRRADRNLLFLLCSKNDNKRQQQHQFRIHIQRGCQANALPQSRVANRLLSEHASPNRIDELLRRSSAWQKRDSFLRRHCCRRK